MLLGATCFSGISFSQTTATASTQKVAWMTNMSEAIQKSKETGKPIMLFFTGSDWCGWCKRLQNEVFFTKDFISWVEANVIPVEVDFPRTVAQEQSLKEQNAFLQQLFKISGYPTVVFVNAGDPDASNNINLTELGRTGYMAGGPSTWIANAKTIIKK